MLEADAAAIYGVIKSLSQEAERTLLRHLKPEMRAAVWRHHLQTFADAHPELTAEQREVIEEGCALLEQPGFFTGDRHGFEEHKARTEAVFSPEQLYSLFFRLGPSRD